MSRFSPFFDPADMTGCFAEDTSIMAINAQAAPHTLFFPLWLEESKSPLAHLQMGAHVSASHRFGALTDNILGLNFRLADGTSVRLGGRTIKNCTGFDLTHFVLGNRQTLGEVTDVILRLRALPGPLHWFGFRMTVEEIEQFRRTLSRSPWWHVLECVDVEIKADSRTLWIGLRSAEETRNHARKWLESVINSHQWVDESEPPAMPLASDASVKLLPSTAVEKASSLVEQFGGHARVHLTCGFFRWSSPSASQATAELAALRSYCVHDGGHLISPHLPEKLSIEEAGWLARLEQEWEAIVV